MSNKILTQLNVINMFSYKVLGDFYYYNLNKIIKPNFLNILLIFLSLLIFIYHTLIKIKCY